MLRADISDARVARDRCHDGDPVSVPVHRPVRASLRTRLGLAAAALSLISLFVFAPPVSAGSCGGGRGDSPPEGRPYRKDSEGRPASERKYLALTTTNANGVRDHCECTEPRDWEWGLDAAAIASVKAAMDSKEALASHNYAKFGVPPEQVPVEARTIWFRTTWRTNAEQVCLRSTLGAGAAVPGTSRHEWGMAVDIEDWGPEHGGVDAGFLQFNGWCRTVWSEPWHFEYRPVLARFGLAGRCIK